MIPRSIKAWLFMYGLFFGSVIGGSLALLGTVLGFAWVLWFFLCFGSLLLSLLIEWKHQKLFRKMLPTLSGEIGLLKWLRKALGREKEKGKNA